MNVVKGLEDFEYIFSLSAPDTRMGILGILDGILGVGDKIRLLALFLGFFFKIR